MKKYENVPRRDYESPFLDYWLGDVMVCAYFVKTEEDWNGLKQYWLDNFLVPQGRIDKVEKSLTFPTSIITFEQYDDVVIVDNIEVSDIADTLRMAADTADKIEMEWNEYARS